MYRSSIVLLTAVVLSAAGGCEKRTLVWVSRQDHYEVAVESATKLVAITHNGSQTAVGVADHGDRVVVEAYVRGGGADKADARAALDAIVVTAECQGDSIRMGWNWKTPKLPAWGCEVSFDLKCPSGLDVKLTTHNGRVVVRGISGDCTLETHNGEISSDTNGARVHATTHNGDLNITTTAADVSLDTHNGGISARLNTTGNVGGSIISHNGGIVVSLADTTAVMLDCATHNGRVHCDHNLDQAIAKKTSLKGSIRGGEKTLRIETHNGSIKVQ